MRYILLAAIISTGSIHTMQNSDNSNQVMSIEEIKNQAQSLSNDTSLENEFKSCIKIVNNLAQRDSITSPKAIKSAQDVLYVANKRKQYGTMENISSQNPDLPRKYILAEYINLRNDDSKHINFFLQQLLNEYNKINFE